MKYYRQYKMSEIEEFYYDFIILIYLKKYNFLNIKNLLWLKYKLYKQEIVITFILLVY